MKPPQPINPSPFITLYTPTFRRPQQLSRCLESVTLQTKADEVQHIVVPDHVGHGVSQGLFGRVATYAPAVIGRYVNMLCDDDVLASEDVIAKVQQFADSRDNPPVIVTQVKKGPWTFPLGDPEGEPVCGHMDLTSFIVRSDVWKGSIHAYGSRYEGDFDHAKFLYDRGFGFSFCPIVWAIGAQSNGRPEW